MNTISCGFLVLNSKNEILACHPTGASFNNGCWNVPKGMRESYDESDYITAVRELREETDLEYDIDYDVDLKLVFDPGRMSYLPKKDIHLYVARVVNDDLISSVFCRSTFKNDRGFWIQEMDGFAWTSDIEMFNKGLRPVIKKIFEDMNIELGKVKE
jgi:ADP-ribose pyrophosphatase YjhB (NUDIX family)